MQRRAVVNQRRASFQKRRALRAFDKITQSGNAVLVMHRSAPAQSREFARVRRDNRTRRFQDVQMFSEVEERARVCDERQLRSLQEAAHDLAGAPVETESRPDADRGAVFGRIEQRFDRIFDFRVIGDFGDDLLDKMRAQDGRRFRARRNRHITGAGARRAARAKHRRTGKLLRAGDDERCACGAFVRGRRSFRKQRAQFAGVDRCKTARFCAASSWSEMPMSAKIKSPTSDRGRIQEKPGLQRAERHGGTCLNGNFIGDAAQRIDAARNVDRNRRHSPMRLARG